MDHVDLPLDHDKCDIRIPFLLTPDVQYDGMGLRGFAARHGLSTASNDALSWSRLQKRPAAFGVAFVQAWLYFGLLTELVGHSINPLVFTVEDEFGRKVYSGALAVATNLIAARMPNLHDPQPHLRWKRARTVLRDMGRNDSERLRICRILDWVREQCRQLDRSWDAPAWSEVLLSIFILLDTFDALVLQESPPLKIDIDAPSVRLLRDHMLSRSGWCVHQVKHLCTTTSHLTLFYLANLMRHPRPGVSHDLCYDHDRCIAYNVKSASFETAHTHATCQCTHVMPPVEKMHAILRSGGIPVVKCQYHHDGPPTIDYVYATPGARYAAISHLWSDGLGNQEANSLPKCQLMRLAAQVQESDELLQHRKLGSWYKRPHKDFVYFWFDVYCVPIVTGSTGARAAELQQLKSLALSRMTASYSWAWYVLIFDKEVERITWQHSQIELAARTAVSAWNSRCWTYQEYTLGRLVLFHGRDGPQLPWARGDCDHSPDDTFDSQLTKKHLWQKMKELAHHSELSFRSGISDYATVKHWGQSKRALWRYDPRDRQSVLRSVCGNFREKATTKLEDVVQILANILDLNGAEVMYLPRDQQTKAILMTFRQLPLGMLFANAQRLRPQPDQTLTGRDVIADDLWVPFDLPGAIARDDSAMMKSTRNGLSLKASHIRSRLLFKVVSPMKPRFDVSLPDSAGQTLELAIDVDVWPHSLREAIIMIDGDPVSVHSGRCMQGRGACFLPTTSERRVLFVSALSWRQMEDADISTAEQYFTTTFDVESDKDFVITCDMSKWPRLSVRRDVLNRYRLSPRTRSIITRTAATLALLLAISTWVGARTKEGWQLPWYFYLGSLYASVFFHTWFFGMFVWLPMFAWHRTLEYISLHSHLDVFAGKSPLYKKLHRMLPPANAELIGWSEKIVVLVFRLGLLPLQLMSLLGETLANGFSHLQAMAHSVYDAMPSRRNTGIELA